MEKNNIPLQFAARLQKAMITAGYHSARSTSGVDIHKLAEMTGYSPQICRKYLRGEAIPEPNKLIELASKLNVSPGWLLFGDGSGYQAGQTISINKNLLHYIFTQAGELHDRNLPKEEISDFLLDITHDISKIHTDEEQSKKIIDLALSSIKHFR
jgi:transcriptional regulator with XRE-family HTH domain